MGLLDWITDGGGALFGNGGLDPSNPTAPPPQQPPMPMPQQPPPMPPQAAAGPPLTGDFDQNGLPPPQGGGAPPLPPQLAGAGGPPPGLPGGAEPMPQGGPMPPPPVPMPQTRPAGAPPPVQNAVPPPPPETPPGATTPPGAAPTGGASPTGPDAAFARLQNPGDAGLLGSAFGMNPHDAMMVRGSLGAGLKAAGNSAGKSPFQALTSGAGEALEGGQKTSETNNKQTLDYLNTAIKAKAAGDEAGYKTNYLKYLQASLKNDTDKVSSANSPQRLYLDAAARTNNDPVLNALRDQVRKATSPEDIARAQANLKQAQTEVMNGHLAGVGLDPKVAAQIAQQPGMTPGNPIDGKKEGLTEENITKKLQPGQIYSNPKDGQLYTYDGAGKSKRTGVKGIPDKPTAPKPADPLKPEKGTRASADTSDTTDQDGPG